MYCKNDIYPVYPQDQIVLFSGDNPSSDDSKQVDIWTPMKCSDIYIYIYLPVQICVDAIYGNGLILPVTSHP